MSRSSSSRRRLDQVDYKRAKTLGQTNRKPVGSVVHATRILRHLSAVQSPMRVTHIALDLGINISTCFNILNTLVQEGFVHFSPRVKGYSIGSQVVALARGAIDPHGAIAAVQPRMRQIAQAQNLILTIWKRSSIDRMTLVACAESDAAIRLHLTVGHSVPLLLGAVGRAMATRISATTEELERQFADVRWHTPITFDAFLTEAHRAREVGYAIDNCMANRGLVSISVPVLDRDGHADIACCGSLFAGSYPAEQLQAIAFDLTEISETLANLTYTTDS